MMPPKLIIAALDTALSMLPPEMDTQAARVQIVATGLQESRFQFRKQINGPAKGFYQFERGGGIHGVLHHPTTFNHIRSVLKALCYDFSEHTSYVAIEHNDVLATVYARLNYWWLPYPMPHDDADAAWKYYIEAWRPGKPHPHTWAEHYAKAKEICI